MRRAVNARYAGTTTTPVAMVPQLSLCNLEVLRLENSFADFTQLLLLLTDSGDLLLRKKLRIHRQE